MRTGSSQILQDSCGNETGVEGLL